MPVPDSPMVDLLGALQKSVDRAREDRKARASACATEIPECSCAMTESSFRACERHGEDAVCPDCGTPWIDHPEAVA